MVAPRLGVQIGLKTDFRCSHFHQSLVNHSGKRQLEGWMGIDNGSAPKVLVSVMYVLHSRLCVCLCIVSRPYNFKQFSGNLFLCFHSNK